MAIRPYLVAGMLHPAHLLDIIRNFTLFQQSSGKNIKIVGRYQQFRDVQEAVRRLENGQQMIQLGSSGATKPTARRHPRKVSG